MKLKREDNWGHLTYRLPDGSVFEPIMGSKVVVEFPDASFANVEAEERVSEVSVPDHGHPYRAQRIERGFTIIQRGVPVWVDFADVEIMQWT